MFGVADFLCRYLDLKAPGISHRQYFRVFYSEKSLYWATSPKYLCFTMFARIAKKNGDLSLLLNFRIYWRSKFVTITLPAASPGHYNHYACTISSSTRLSSKQWKIHQQTLPIRHGQLCFPLLFEQKE